MKKFLFIFSALLLGLSLVYNLDPVMNGLVAPWNRVLAEASYFIMQATDVSVDLRVNILTNPLNGFSVAVENDCNGIEATIILVSAILAYPASVKRKALGLLIGVSVIQVINVVRIVTLFHVGQWSTPVFDLTHKYIWPALIIMAALLMFVLWTRKTVAAGGGT